MIRSRASSGLPAQFAEQPFQQRRAILNRRHRHRRHGLRRLRVDQVLAQVPLAEQGAVPRVGFDPARNLSKEASAAGRAGGRRCGRRRDRTCGIVVRGMRSPAGVRAVRRSSACPLSSGRTREAAKRMGGAQDMPLLGGRRFSRPGWQAGSICCLSSSSTRRGVRTPSRSAAGRGAYRKEPTWPMLNSGGDTGPPGLTITLNSDAGMTA